VLLDVEQIKNKKLQKNVPPLEDQRSNESQKIWLDLANSIKKRDLDSAMKAKFEIEEEQRKIRAKYEEENIIWKPKFFKQKDNSNVKGFWQFIGSDNDEYKEIYEFTNKVNKNKIVKKDIKENTESINESLNESINNESVNNESINNESINNEKNNTNND
jgi:hypothetical protein